MDLFSLMVSAISVTAGALFLLIGGSYIAYRIKKKM
jgi:hypothetical protein